MTTPLLTGDALREWRERQKLTQDQLAAELQISREWIGKLERGERPVSAEIYLRFESLKREPRFSTGGGVLGDGQPFTAKLKVTKITRAGKSESGSSSRNWHHWTSEMHEEYRKIFADVMLFDGLAPDADGPTPEDCFRYLAKVMLETEGKPGRVGYVYGLLTKAIPLGYWKIGAAHSDNPDAISRSPPAPPATGTSPH